MINTKYHQSGAKSISLVRRQLLLLPLLAWGGQLLSAEAPAPAPSGSCPLNSGGPTLLGTRWRLMSIYGTVVPDALHINMEVGDHSMSGKGGCNNYSAQFAQVGNRGFKVTRIVRPEAPCEVLRTTPGAPTIDVGSWEGQYLKVLRRAGSVQRRGFTLQFFDFNGKASIVFGRRYS